MALKEDQRAMLQLLLERGQSYGDLASLLGVDEDEVRTRARDALSEIGGTDPDREVALSDYLLGQADPIGRADAARHLKEDPEDHGLAEKLIAQLRLIAPAAELPKLPSAPKRPRVPVRTPKPEREKAGAGEDEEKPRARRVPSLPSLPTLPSGGAANRTRLLAALGAGGLVLVVVVLAIAGVFGGGDDSSSASDAPAAPDEEIETVRLRPSEGGDARGTATFGIASGNTPFLEVNIERLEPAPQGKAYVLWLLLSEELGHPLSPFEVRQDGTFDERLPIASFLTEIAARTRFVDVSLSDQGPLLKRIERAVDQGTPVIPYEGESLLRGTVPTVPATETGAGALPETLPDGAGTGAQVPGG